MTRTVTLRAVALGSLCALALARAGGGQDYEAAWKASGDACWPVKRQKLQIKAMTGKDAPYITCKPVHIRLEWRLEERFEHHSRFGTDRFSAAFTSAFDGYARVVYDQFDRKAVDDVLVLGPFPGGPLGVEPARLEASVLGSTKWGDKTKRFEASGYDIHYDTAKPGHFSWKWERSGLGRELAIAGPRFDLDDGVVSPPYRWVTYGSGVMDSDRYKVRAKGDEAPDWEEVRPAFETQGAWRRTFPVAAHQDFPSAEFYDLKGTVSVEVDFGDRETEEWAVTVTGSERDPFGANLPAGPPKGGLPQAAGVNVRFDWTLQGRFTLVKRKGTRTWDSGQIVSYAQAPEVELTAPNLWRVDLLACEGVKTWEQTGAIAGMILDGSVQGSSVRLKWWPHPAKACVLCTPKKSTLSKLPVRKTFGSAEFVKSVNASLVPLKDGATVKGGVSDWLTYAITLRKVR